ncbi:MAG: hypothetical protein HUN05_24000 [Desulfobacter sp.]|nr:MAG: hypothetical protein HUN05_24000 [Desulfobacter sp.]
MRPKKVTRQDRLIQFCLDDQVNDYRRAQAFALLSDISFLLSKINDEKTDYGTRLLSAAAGIKQAENADDIAVKQIFKAGDRLLAAENRFHQDHPVFPFNLVDLAPDLSFNQILRMIFDQTKDIAFLLEVKKATQSNNLVDAIEHRILLLVKTTGQVLAIKDLKMLTRIAIHTWKEEVGLEALRQINDIPSLILIYTSLAQKDNYSDQIRYSARNKLEKRVSMVKEDDQLLKIALTPGLDRYVIDAAVNGIQSHDLLVGKFLSLENSQTRTSIADRLLKSLDKINDKELLFLLVDQGSYGINEKYPAVDKINDPQSLIRLANLRLEDNLMGHVIGSIDHKDILLKIAKTAKTSMAREKAFEKLAEFRCCFEGWHDCDFLSQIGRLKMILLEQSVQHGYGRMRLKIDHKCYTQPYKIKSGKAACNKAIVFLTIQLKNPAGKTIRSYKSHENKTDIQFRETEYDCNTVCPQGVEDFVRSVIGLLDKPDRDRLLSEYYQAG